MKIFNMNKINLKLKSMSKCAIGPVVVIHSNFLFLPVLNHIGLLIFLRLINIFLLEITLIINH